MICIKFSSLFYEINSFFCIKKSQIFKKSENILKIMPNVEHDNIKFNLIGSLCDLIIFTEWNRQNQFIEHG